MKHIIEIIFVVGQFLFAFNCYKCGQQSQKTKTLKKIIKYPICEFDYTHRKVDFIELANSI